MTRGCRPLRRSRHGGTPHSGLSSSHRLPSTRLFDRVGRDLEHWQPAELVVVSPAGRFRSAWRLTLSGLTRADVWGSAGRTSTSRQASSRSHRAELRWTAATTRRPKSRQRVRRLPWRTTSREVACSSRSRRRGQPTGSAVRRAWSAVRSRRRARAADPAAAIGPISPTQRRCWRPRDHAALSAPLARVLAAPDRCGASRRGGSARAHSGGPPRPTCHTLALPGSPRRRRLSGGRRQQQRGSARCRAVLVRYPSIVRGRCERQRESPPG